MKNFITLSTILLPIVSFSQKYRKYYDTEIIKHLKKDTNSKNEIALKNDSEKD